MPPRPAPPPLEQTARVFHALSDPTRLNLVALLRGGERCVCDLTDALEAGQSRLSFHLRTLKDAGLVLDRREGRWVYYRLNQAKVEEMAGVLTNCCAPHRAWLKGACCG
jgi:ArsR family transcriptional regulator